MESFAPLIAPWFLESSFIDGHHHHYYHQDLDQYHPVTTAIPSASLSCSSSYSCNNNDSISHHAAEHPMVTQHCAEFYPSPTYSPVQDVYSPFVVPPPQHSTGMSTENHQPVADATTMIATQQQHHRRPRTKSASLQQKQPHHHNYLCQYPGCGKAFTRPYNLTSHMRTHTSERPYACSHCGRRFARQHDRNRHEKLHWNIKPYICTNCSKPFARMDALNRHLKVENGCGSAVAAVAAAAAAAAIAATTSNTLFLYHPTP